MITKDKKSIMDIVNNINIPGSHVHTIHVYQISK